MPGTWELHFSDPYGDGGNCVFLAPLRGLGTCFFLAPCGDGSHWPAATGNRPLSRPVACFICLYFSCDLFSVLLSAKKPPAPPPWPPKKDPLFSFQRPCSPLPVSKRRSPLRKRPGSDKPISLHFLRLGLEWVGLVYCGAFARTIKRILPPRG